MHALGDPQNDLRYIHVAGTNGNGSTSAMIESVLRHAGYKTGLYTSPALAEFNERIRIDGENIPDGDFVNLIPRVTDAALAVEKQGFETVCEFEFVTALAFLYFKLKKVDIVVLEVGLGGKLDATNVINAPLAAVITAIGLDHTDRLGDTISEIAGEKAGIIKPGSTVISYDQTDDARKVIAEKAAEAGDEIIFADNGAIKPVSASVHGQCFDYKDFKKISIPLIGTHQPYNASVALEVISVLRGKSFDIPDKAIYSGLASVEWRGRLEVLREDPLFLLDGAHNVHGVTALAGSLSSLFPGEKFIFVCCMMADKSYDEMLRISSPLCGFMITTAPSDNHRAADGETLANTARKYCGSVTATDSIADAVDTAIAMQAKTGLPVCCFGTLYMSGEIRRYFQAKEVRSDEK